MAGLYAQGLRHFYFNQFTFFNFILQHFAGMGGDFGVNGLLMASKYNVFIFHNFQRCSVTASTIVGFTIYFIRYRLPF